MSFNFLFPIFYRFLASPNAVFRFTAFVIILCSSLHSEKLSIIKSSENGVTEYFILSEDGRKKIELPKKHIETSKHRYGNLQFEKFSEGLARYTAVQIYWHQGGFFDSSGKVRFTYSDGPYADFSEGLSVQVQRDYWNRKLHFVDKNGRKILTGFYGAGSFSNGLAPVSKTGRNTAVSDEVPVFTHLKWGYINKKNQFIIKPQYSDAKPFTSEGTAFAKKGGKWTVIRNSEGEREFDLLLGGKWGLINLKGKNISKFIFDDFRNFSYGAAAVLTGAEQVWELDHIAPDGHAYAWKQFKKGKWGFINSSGKYILSAEFDEVRSFNPEGTALVKKGGNWRLDRTERKSRRVYLENGKWAVIDRKGKYLTEFKFDHVGSFHEGLCAFLEGAENVKVRDYNDAYGDADIKGGKWGYIDWQGKTLIPAQFDFAGKFLNGIARVRIGEDWKCINREGTAEDCVQGD